MEERTTDRKDKKRETKMQSDLKGREDELTGLKCPFCFKVFLNREGLKGHIKIHDPNKTFRCEKCEYSTNSSGNLKRHMITHGQRQSLKGLKCPACFKFFINRDSFKKHMQIHDPDITFRCQQCEYSTNFKENLKKHMVTHGPRQSLNCAFCDQLFSNVISYKTHVKMHTEEPKLYECREWKFTTRYKVALKQHIAAKHTFTMPKVKCEICDSVVTVRCYKEHLKSHDGVAKTHECQKCKKCFSNARNLKVHNETVHNSIRKWACDLCQKAYSSKAQLVVHIESVHEKKRYECKICNQLYTSKGGLSVHVKIMHSKRRRFSCANCDRTYASADLLKRHLPSHTDKGLKCPHCQKAFSSQYGLQEHLKMKRCPELHGRGKERWSCSICIKSYNKEALLQTHLELVHKIETGRQLFSCEICKKGYYCRKTLKRHMTSHTDDKSKCHTCQKVFTFKSTLVQHLKSGKCAEKLKRNKCAICKLCFPSAAKLRSHGEAAHNSSRNWTCNQCNKSYTVKQALTKHVESVHGQKKHVL